MRRLAATLLLLGLLAAPAAAAGEEGPTVRFDTALGDIDVRLFPDAAPNSVATFLRYVSRGSYVESYFHRLLPGFVIQGGGFRIANGLSTPIVELGADTDLRTLSNARGTLAVARVTDEPRRATPQWFFNAADNGFLDSTPDNYTVFGHVVDDAGLAVVDKLVRQNVLNAAGGESLSAFTSLPVLPDDDFVVELQDLIRVHSVTVAAPVWPPYRLPFGLQESLVDISRTRARNRVTVRGLPENTYVVADSGRRQGVALARDGTARLSLYRSRRRPLELIAFPPGLQPTRATLGG